MVSAGIIQESAYYESLHETPLIANTIARKRLYEMNVVISDTAEYGCYLFNHAAVPMLREYVQNMSSEFLGRGLNDSGNGVDNQRLIEVNAAIRGTGVEKIGAELRGYMTAMQVIVEEK
jgi:ketol-acid reductoisomerase